MKLSGIRIRNYRTIANEQTVDLSRGMTLVGPNNAGKTNILTAIKMLFTGYENVHAYSREHDLTFGERSGQTSLVGVFTGDSAGKDKAIYDLLAELKGMLQAEGAAEYVNDNEIHLYLTFTTTSNPSYRFFPNSKRPTDASGKSAFSRKERDLVQKLLASFVCHYVPSNKSFENIYQEPLTPFIKKHVSKSLENKVKEIENSLATTASSLTSALKDCGLPDISVRFDMPNKALTDLLSGFEFKLRDPNETSVFKKGVGIQSTAILSSFDWITQQEVDGGLEVIWLIEEPEAFLHPTLNTVCKRLLARLQSRSLVVITTHSLSFVPQNPALTAGVTRSDGNKSLISKYKTYRESTEAIRKSIGVKFSDFFNLGQLNVLLEGPSDREYLEWILKILDPADYPLSHLRSSECHYLDYGGVTHLAGFLRATWEFIRSETCVVSVFDGDPAGERERRNLQQYFGQKDIPFQPNDDFISVRKGFPIEALFPDSWISKCKTAHPNWFSDFSVDVSGELEAFELKDGSKKSFAAFVKDLANKAENLEWAKRWIDVCNALDNALRNKKIKLSLSEGAIELADLTEDTEPLNENDIDIDAAKNTEPVAIA
ncbi:AAA family ATPase [Pseudomonas entomophila]|uniref:ATP-dependent nuclease n=1 Tax=Pseudomonas entomophila TaxID=312306 RepID=UPI001BCF1583|nr:AAA family ATPase [Pseudomonas entomophila]QVM89815.1 AAA family ATPase [Pseudomonas entomophila]